MIKTVSIFGGGISGMTVAHELIEKGFKVNVYEKDELLGGMAKSKRNSKNIPIEHSWRGYGPFYHNVFDILKRIPIDENCQKEKYDEKKTFSIDEIKKHNSSESLWTYYKGKVYDITDFINKHPGGKIIMKSGGNNIEEIWNKYNVSWHMKSNSVLKRLEKYYIGDLKENYESFSSSVFDNLSNEYLNFEYLDNERLSDEIKISFGDSVFIYYLYLKFITSTEQRQKQFYEEYMIKYKDSVNKNSYDYISYGISGPGYGFDVNTISLGHMLSFVERQNNEKIKLWKAMCKPTNESWFDPWRKYLENKGVVFYMNTELQSITYNNDKKITSCILKNGDIIISDEYCLCINPFDAIEIFNISSMTELYNQHLSLKTINNQISFYISFSEKINFPDDKNAFVIIDSEYNITFYPQDKIWCKNVDLGDKTLSLWSGTCIFSQNGISLSKEKFTENVLKQILNSKPLIEKIKKYNKNILSLEKIINSIEIYDEWENNIESESLQAKNKKWVNNVENEKYRPDSETIYSNLYIGGAHCKTSINIWSMESAVESGKKVSNLILNKYEIKNINVYNHESSSFIKILKNIDGLIYTFGAPNIIDVLILFFIIYLLVSIIIKLKDKISFLKTTKNKNKNELL